MIQVIYYREYHRVTIDGHALSGTPGHDLVCAGASTLAYTLAANVVKLDNMNQIRDSVIVLEPGKAEISCKPRGKYIAIVSLVFNAVCVGFELMARDNPGYITYEIRG